ncbi:MAG: efflux RND transporter permease subunit [Phycisphaerales bacterium]|nr:efflux RND transporter permease subunit [Phycisphaerales bacterium]
MRNLVVAVAQDSPVYLKDVAQVIDGPAEATGYVRHGWGLEQACSPMAMQVARRSWKII